jgi:glycosyltransferase involved in cell wall biosynthesis
VFLGRIHQGKGVFDLVKIWKQVLSIFPKADKLVLIGSGDRETTLKLEELIKKENLSQKIILVGFVSREKKYEILKKSKLFLYPSYYDANPISTVEAIACGLPIVAYELPIFLEHYPKELAEFVPKGNIEIFSQKVVAILTDQKKREKMSDFGIKWTKRISWKSIFERQEEVILKILMKKSDK